MDASQECLRMSCLTQIQSVYALCQRTHIGLVESSDSRRFLAACCRVNQQAVRLRTTITYALSQAG